MWNGSWFLIKPLHLWKNVTVVLICHSLKNQNKLLKNIFKIIFIDFPYRTALNELNLEKIETNLQLVFLVRLYDEDSDDDYNDDDAGRDVSFM